MARGSSGGAAVQTGILVENGFDAVVGGIHLELVGYGRALMKGLFK